MDEGLATIVLSRGISDKELLEMVEKKNLKLISMIAKTPVLNQVYTFTFNQVQTISDDQKTILDYNIDRHYQAVENISKSLASDLLSDSLSEKNRAAKELDVKKYSILGKAPLLFYQIQVFGTYGDLTGLQRNYNSRVLASIGNPGVENVKQSLKAKKYAPTFDFTSNDTYKQSSIHLKTNNSTADESISAGTNCGGSGAPEFNCPPDPFWLPPAQTIELNIRISNSGGGNTGDPAMKSGFIRQTWNWHTVDQPGFPGLKSNTIAFKANFLPACNPEVVGNLTAPCGGNTPQEDVYYVPEATYEQEGSIENWTCSGTRTGRPSDRDRGCFLASYSSSNLPAPYLDTTVSDPWLEYVATMGTIEPRSLLEGSRYETYIEYWALKHEDFSGKRVRVNGQIGTDYRAIPLPTPLRVFAVDTTRLLEGVLTPE